jgi:Mn2+/Fe2+ NRAMP family transporter
MTFFQAQKKLIRLWFIWCMILLAYVAFQTIISTGVFSPPEVASKMWEWIGKYLASIFALIIGSSFFNKEANSPTLKDPIYFSLSFYTSMIYLAAITAMILVIILSCEDHASFEEALERTSQVLNFMLPIVTGLLGYFFYKSKNGEATPAEPADTP